MRTSISTLGVLCAALVLPLLPGCGGGGGGGGGGSDGDVQMAVTDSPSDQIDLFEVDVRSLTLHRLDGAVVEALPRVTRIDFADLVTLSELFTRATVPAGTYDSLALTLDLSTAAVHIDGQASNATVLDADGNPGTAPTTVTVTFPNDRRLVVLPAVQRFVELDFDLDASTTVDTASNTVRVGAVLYARAEPSDPKPLRAYGRLVSVDEAGSAFTFVLLRRRELGAGVEHTATTDSSTAFEVDGTAATGAAGLALLAAKPRGTRLEVQGSLDPATHAFLARSVEAGRGEFDGTRDFVEGLVLSRSGGAGTDPVLTVRGMGVDRHVSVSFNTTFTVDASFASTKVVEHAHPGAYDCDDVNVGQRIVAFGTLTGTTLDATVAGDGLVRLVETGVSGLALGPVASQVLTADVQHIGRRPAAAFDFSVGGSVLATASALKIGTGTLSLPGIGASSAIVARGFFVSVDADPAGPDFQATTVVDRTATASLLAVRWATPSAAPFAAASSSGATVDISAATSAKVDVGAVALVDLLGGTNPEIVPAASGGHFAVVEGGAVTLYDDFGLWLADVQGRLSRTSGAVAAARIDAIGSWDGASRTLSARHLAVFMR